MKSQSLKWLLVLCFSPLARSEVVPDPNRGLYAIWTKPEISDKLPLIKGGQVVLQSISKPGRFTTVQSNANRQQEWLFNHKVPVLKLKRVNVGSEGRDAGIGITMRVEYRKTVSVSLPYTAAERRGF